LRAARIAIAIACLAWYGRFAEERFSSILAVLAAYLAYSIGALFELRLDSPLRARVALVADVAFFGFWSWVVASGLVAWPTAGWMSAVLCGYVLTTAAILHDLPRTAGAVAVVILLAALFAPHGEMPLVWVAMAGGGLAMGVTF